MICESKYCKADKDYRNAFDLTEDGKTITIYLEEIKKHSHAIQFIFHDKPFLMGQKGGILQIWEDEEQVLQRSNSND